MPSKESPRVTEGQTLILFLDFDGVLHSSDGAGPLPLLVCVPRLAAWLEEWPGVDVVISSSWRTDHSQRELVDLLGPIGSRVVGSTPTVPHQRDDNVYPSSKMAVFTHERQKEIEFWMALSWDPARPWVALDDMPFLFEPDCPHLVVCSRSHGLSQENLLALDRHALEAGLTRSARRDTADGFTLASGAPNDAAPLSRFRNFDTYVNHTGSCLPDCLLRVTVDQLHFVVTIAADAFDSALVGDLVTRVLPSHGIVAFRDDKHWVPPPATYDVRIRVGSEAGVELRADVVRLSTAVGGGGGVAVRLSDPRQLMAGEASSGHG